MGEFVLCWFKPRCRTLLLRDVCPGKQLLPKGLSFVSIEHLLRCIALDFHKLLELLEEGRSRSMVSTGSLPLYDDTVKILMFPKY